MAINVTANIQQALHALEAERKRIDEQIGALQRVLALTDGRAAKPGPTRAGVAPTTSKRHGMSAKARQAARERMRAYWAKRRAAKGQKAK